MENELQTSQWETYLKYGTRKFAKKETILYNMGDSANGFYYIKKGIVKILTYTQDGEEKCFDFRGQGQLFGEWGLIKEPYITGAIAKEDCILYYFSNESFRKMISISEESLKLFLDFVYKVIWDRTQQNFYPSNTEQQMAYAINKLNELSTATNVIHISQQELANYIGLTRITVNKFLQKLKDKDIIELNNKEIIIKDVEYFLQINKSETR
ncbi:Crp/Fnr family transcriptional regulator [Bacillus sp. FJAT-45350]|uniref:Crp/Fnr family transcriptional regulator n=1 Tax=Bacillus sp. FJAT-45350 TaxID=2011014 RepID=UPI000BB955FE|nr:Crp/Fnr family transcriptional regulator [Bacillus sp. FJAT-45350]